MRRILSLDGQLDAGRLAAMPPGDALASLRRLPGIGPAYATLILLRATGVADVLWRVTAKRSPGPRKPSQALPGDPSQAGGGAKERDRS